MDFELSVLVVSPFFFFLGAAVLFLVLGGIIGCVVSVSGEGVDCFLFVRIADGSWIGCFVSVICSLGWCGVICDGGSVDLLLVHLILVFLVSSVSSSLFLVF